ncbi:hypothetical protein KQI65_13765 [bacterium]|nr:hypothetical protein [bacterium]
MGKMLVILVIGMGLIASWSMMQLNESNMNVTDNASDDYEINQARNLAASGVEHAIMELAQDSTWSSGYKSEMASGTVAVSIERTRAMYPGGPDEGLNNARLITATGVVQGRTVTVRTVVEIPSVYVRPPGLGYGIFSDQSMDLSGNIFAGDYNNPSLNANIHTNNDLTYGGSTKVEGYGTFSESCPSGTGDAAKYFDPNRDSGGDLVYKDDPVAIPEIDPDKWEHLATRKFYSNTKVTGKMKLGTKEQPEIIFVQGDLDLNAQMEGYGVFLVTGDLKINGQATVSAVDPSGNNLGIIVGGDAQINGTSDIEATLLIKGNAKINGTTRIVGSIIAEGELNFGGTADVLYNPMLDELARKIWEGKAERPRIVSYYE